MANYGLIVQTIELKPGGEDASAAEVSQGLAISLNETLKAASRGVENFPRGGKGELLSHNIVRLGSHLVVSYLFKK